MRQHFQELDAGGVVAQTLADLLADGVDGKGIVKRANQAQRLNPHLEAIADALA
jgi:hypothetical protein